jgi:hypothetical protein
LYRVNPNTGKRAPNKLLRTALAAMMLAAWIVNASIKESNPYLKRTNSQVLEERGRVNIRYAKPSALWEHGSMANMTYTALEGLADL